MKTCFQDIESTFNVFPFRLHEVVSEIHERVQIVRIIHQKFGNINIPSVNIQPQTSLLGGGTVFTKYFVPNGIIYGMISELFQEFIVTVRSFIIQGTQMISTDGNETSMMIHGTLSSDTWWSILTPEQSSPLWCTHIPLDVYPIHEPHTYRETSPRRLVENRF